MRRPDLTIATADHNVPTKDIDKPIEDEISRAQLAALDANCAEFGVACYPMGDPNQGIVHVIGPELGLTQPGMTIVCGDQPHLDARGLRRPGVRHRHLRGSSTCSPLRTLPQRRPKTMAVEVEGEVPEGVTAKDITLAINGRLGTGGGIGHVIEYRGSADPRALDGGPNDALQHVDRGRRSRGAWSHRTRPPSPTSPGAHTLRRAPSSRPRSRDWKTLRTDEGATFDTVVTLDATQIRPHVTWGKPTRVRSSHSTTRSPIPPATPTPANARRPSGRSSTWASKPGPRCATSPVDTIFIGSCTNSRIEDLRLAASVVDGHKVKEGMRAMVVPGSRRVRDQAEAEGLDKIFLAAGFEWREPGCSMCLAMNPDFLEPGERAASTSNRNFEGRQGRGGRTHLVSPAVAAATAIVGRFASPAELN